MLQGNKYFREQSEAILDGLDLRISTCTGLFVLTKKESSNKHTIQWYIDSVFNKPANIGAFAASRKFTGKLTLTLINADRFFFTVRPSRTSNLPFGTIKTTLIVPETYREKDYTPCSLDGMTWKTQFADGVPDTDSINKIVRFLKYELLFSEEVSEHLDPETRYIIGWLTDAGEVCVNLDFANAVLGSTNASPEVAVKNSSMAKYVMNASACLESWGKTAPKGTEPFLQSRLLGYCPREPVADGERTSTVCTSVIKALIGQSVYGLPRTHSTVPDESVHDTHRWLDQAKLLLESSRTLSLSSLSRSVATPL